MQILGQMILVNGGNNLLYINSPHITTVRGLLDVNIFLSDIQMHDATRDLIMLNQSRMCQQELKYDIINHTYPVGGGHLHGGRVGG